MTRILEIEEHSHRLRSYAGDYEAYRMAAEAERAKQAEDYERQQPELKMLRRKIRTARATSAFRGPKDGDKYIRQFKKEQSQLVASRSIRNAGERLRRIEDDPVPRPANPLRFRTAFAESAMEAREVIRLTGVGKSYGDKCVLRDVALAVGHDSRIVPVGPNGSGKATLLRIIVGEEPADDGEISFTPGVRIGYLPQESVVDDTTAAVTEAYSRGRVGRAEDFVSELLRCDLFRLEDIENPVGELDLGQVRKLEIAMLIAAQPNVLILDEPTNSVSLDVVETLETAIAEFPGPVLVASHDRWFVQRFGGAVYHFHEGEMRQR
jgi:macrolide transport system ATP-binding/permease protein